MDFCVSIVFSSRAFNNVFHLNPSTSGLFKLFFLGYCKDISVERHPQNSPRDGGSLFQMFFVIQILLTLA